MKKREIKKRYRELEKRKKLIENILKNIDIFSSSEREVIREYIEREKKVIEIEKINLKKEVIR